MKDFHRRRRKTGAVAAGYYQCCVLVNPFLEYVDDAARSGRQATVTKMGNDTGLASNEILKPPCPRRD